MDKNITITKKEHDLWHKEHSDEYDATMDKEHKECHKKCGIKIKN